MNSVYQNYFLDTLRFLVSAQSVSGNEKDAVSRISDVLIRMGYQADIRPIGKNGANLTCLIPGCHDHVIMIGGHIDTVDIMEGWRYDPLTINIEGKRAYGLGAGDMKGGIAALLTVLKILNDAHKKPYANVLFTVFSDEERFSAGAEEFAGQSHKNIVYCVMAEPHYHEFVIGATGKVLLKLTINGVSGHAAKPETGVSAIENAVSFLYYINKKYSDCYKKGECGSQCALHIWNDYPQYNLNIPAQCSILLNKQLLPQEKESDFITDLKVIFAQTCPKCNLVIEEQKPHYPSYITNRENPYLRRLVQIASGIQGSTVNLCINNSVSDGNIMETKLGIPTVLFGPQGIDIHKPNEYLLLDTVPGYIDAMIRFLTNEDESCSD